jgi:uncharacterized protein (TIGR02271 family)
MEQRTVAGVFDSNDEARAVRQELIDSGIPQERLHVESGPARAIDQNEGRASDDRDAGFLTRLLQWFEGEDEHAGQFAEAVRRGSCVVVADGIDADKVEQVADMMSRRGAVDVNARVTNWRERGWTGYDATAPALSGEELRSERDLAVRAAGVAAGEEQRTVIPVVEEQLQVGKRIVDRGGVRIFSRVSERPVEEQVTLREERARVERHATDRAATPQEMAQAFKEDSMELRETTEEAVVSKTARVVEEVEVTKEVGERTEQVRDTVRRTDVGVEDMSRGRADVPRGPVTGARPIAAASAASDSSADVDGLNKLLRDELSAVETYRQALDKNRDQYGKDPRFEQLVGIYEDHQRAASQLRNIIADSGGTPSEDSGAWGTWANTVMGTARLFGDNAALKALKEGEESGAKDYESVVEDGAPAQLQAMIGRQQQHVQALDRMMARH